MVPAHFKRLTLTGWGRATHAESAAFRPERQADAAAAMAGGGDDAASIVARGAGRSYGDAALNGGGAVLLTERLNRMLEFDPATGALVCEPGVTFADLIGVFLPRGFLPPAMPGTGFVTLGGAIANDVHGKNHDAAGSFGDHVRWFDLALPSGEIRRVDALSDPDLFAATIGGIGLTGLIVRLSFTMVPAASSLMRVTERRMETLDAFLAALAEARNSAAYSVGWVDALARDGALGRGILETAEIAPQGASGTAGTTSATGTTSALGGARSRVPFELPVSLIARPSVRLFNALYYRHVPGAGRSRDLPAAKFFFPLDRIGDWNRLYGRRGFYQFQAVVPDGAAGAIRAMLEAASAAGTGSFLAVLKTLGGSGRGYLSFPMRGLTLALDLPRGPANAALVRRLGDIAADHGGRVYLAKDALLDANSFAAMYPRADALRAVLARIDPGGRLGSDMARRLGLIGVGP